MRTYILLIIAALLSETSINLPVGSLPLALTQDGANENQVSIAMGCGMLAAFFLSLPLGATVDRIGKLPVLRAAAVGSGLIMVAMWCSHGVMAACIEMSIRSILLVAYMTAMFAYASNIFSKERMVSAVASLGIIGNVAFAVGPAVGVWLWKHGVQHDQYLYASILNLLSAGLMMFLPKKFDTKPEKPRPFNVKIDPHWLPGMAFILTCSLQGGVSFALAVLEFQERGIANEALLFTSTAVTTILLRYLAGRMVEKFGARKVAIPTVLMQSIGCVFAATASDWTFVMVAGIFLGFAWAAVPPIGIALIFEKCPEDARGTAMGSYNLSMSGGFGLGSALAAVVTALSFGYAQAILICALLPSLSLIALRKDRRSG
ncbi:MAG: MFS transporter [Candidatus Obscuribacterales bacterium]|nr:MFS transporter [Candidatus Obscuribacterales bacterium]